MTLHPAEAEAWEWDEGNEGELAKHGIAPSEVEQVWLNGARFAPNIRRGSGDWKMLGRTNGGRALTVVLRFDASRLTLRPVTGWDMTRGERSRYFKGGLR